jgi:ActR/RegA family two-component response regulator
MVDDEPRIISSLLRALRREGYELLSAERPEDALRLGRGARDRLRALRLQDARDDGTELLERIARRPRTPRALLLTGWTRGSIARRSSHRRSMPCCRSLGRRRAQAHAPQGMGIVDD